VLPAYQISNREATKNTMPKVKTSLIQEQKKGSSKLKAGFVDTLFQVYMFLNKRIRAEKRK
jgi:hypothetical protein